MPVVPRLPVLYGANPFTIVRSVDGGLFAPLTVARNRDGHIWPAVPQSIFDGQFIDASPNGQVACQRPILMGPLDRLYWQENVDTVKQCNGTPPTVLVEAASSINGSPQPETLYGLFVTPDMYATDGSRAVPTDDRLYIAYATAASTHFRVAYWSGTAWTILPDGSRSLATGSGAIGQIPAGAHAGQLIVGWQNDGGAIPGPGVQNVIQRWDGAAWIDDFTVPIETTVRGLVPWAGTTILTLEVKFSSALGFPLVYQRAGDGTWTDITPASWGDDPIGTPISQPARACASVEYNGEFYVAWRTESYSRNEIWKRTPGTPVDIWSLDLDLVTEGTGANTAPMQLVVIDGDLYVGCESYGPGSGFEINYLLVKRGGVWVRQPAGGDTTISYITQSLEGTVVPPEGNCSGVYSPTVRVRAYWDRPRAFTGWEPAPFTTWSLGAYIYQGSSYASVNYENIAGNPTLEQRVNGLWGVYGPLGQPYPFPSPTDFGDVTTSTIVNLGSPLAIDTPFSDPLFDIQYGWTIHSGGLVNVVDALVLTFRPGNGTGVVNFNAQDSYYELEEQPATVASPATLVWVPKLATTRIPLSYEYLCPVVTAITPASGSALGGGTTVLTGTNFYSDQWPFQRFRLNNRIIVRTSSGRMEEVPYGSVTFVDTEHISFPMPAFPGGDDPVVEVIFRPANLAPIGFDSVSWDGSYSCGTSSIPYTYTDIGLIGSLDTLLGLGGNGADITIDNGPFPVLPLWNVLGLGGFGADIEVHCDAHGCVPPDNAVAATGVIGGPCIPLEGPPGGCTS